MKLTLTKLDGSHSFMESRGLANARLGMRMICQDEAQGLIPDLHAVIS
jgi:hypothetical protein